ncbi:MAG: accessory gene regulator B family protein [Lachnospiraceae bacterium]|nr:accessory gene regulator B family protein [Lachnospiraceae bacterium]
MNKIDDHITKIISDTMKLEHDSVVSFSYGLSYILSHLLFIFNMLVIGYVFHRLIITIVFLVTILPLRTFSGGFHTKSPVTCLFFTYSISISSIFMIPFLCDIEFRYWLFLIIFNFLISFILIPIMPKNKTICAAALNKTTIICRILSFCLFFISLILYFFNYKKYYTTILLCVIINNISCFARHIQVIQENSHDT